MSKKIRVILAEPYRQAYVMKKFINTLAGFQGYVKGLVDILEVDENIAIVYSENGKDEGKQPNRVVKNIEGIPVGMLYGNFAVVGIKNGDITSIPFSVVDKYLNMLNGASGLVIEDW